MMQNTVKPFAAAEKHYLKYFLTASSGATNFPDFLAQMVADDLQGGYCDSNSNGAKPRHEWAERIVKDDPIELKYSTHVCVHYVYTYRAHAENLKQQFNQSEGMRNSILMFNFMWLLEEDI